MWDKSQSEKCLPTKGVARSQRSPMPHDKHKHGHVFSIKKHPNSDVVIGTKSNLAKEHTIPNQLYQVTNLSLFYLHYQKTSLPPPPLFCKSTQPYQPGGAPPRQWVENRWPCRLYRPSRSWCVDHFSRKPPADPKVHLETFPNEMEVFKWRMLQDGHPQKTGFK